MDASASRVNLLMHCGYWARGDVQPPPSDSGPSADYGVATHTLAEHHGLGTEPVYEELAVLHNLELGTLERAKTDAWALYSWHNTRVKGDKYHEQKVAYDTSTGGARVLLSKTPRDYSERTAVEFPGTADLVAVRPDSATVIDYKTGSTPWEIYKDQLNFLGMCVSKIYNRPRVYCVVLKVDEGECYPHSWILDPTFEARFNEAYSKVATAGPTPGGHCTRLYCPLAGTCPATLGKLEEYTGQSMEAIKPDCNISDHDHFRRLYDVKLLLTKSKKVVEASLKTYVDIHGGVLLDNGKVYKKERNNYREVRVDSPPQNNQNGVEETT